MSEVYTDSHAHLELVAARLGMDALAEILERYTGDARSATHAEGPSNPTNMVPHPARILDIGVAGGDLTRRRELVAEAARARRRALNDLPVRWAAGIWPGKEALAAPQRALDALDLDLETGVDALGECGLDYHHMDAPERDQIALFSAQAERAQVLGLPLIVHSRDAFSDTIRVVAPLAFRIPVIIHCFGYGPAEAEAFVRAGCFVSFAGNITYKKSDALRSALARVPLDRLLLETDAPYMNPMPRRGSPSSPLDIERTYQFAATILETDSSALCRSVAANLDGILGSGGASR